MKNRTAQTGFTFVEIIACLFVMGMTAAVALLAFGNAVNQSHLQQAADRLMADLRTIRTAALRDQQPRICEFDLAALSYRAEGVAAAGLSGEISVSLAAPPYGLSEVKLPPGAPQGAQIVFDAQGHPTPTGFLVLVRGNRSLVIELLAGGRIDQIR